MPEEERRRTHDRDLLKLPGTLGAPALAAERAQVAEIATEFTAAFDALADVGPAVAMFGSARTPRDSPEYELARATARAVGEAGYAVMTGAGPGVMEAANHGARDAGALSIGCNIELPSRQAANAYLDLELSVRHYFVRKVIFFRFACAFVFLPGGAGTLDELFEALALIQVGTIEHFPVILVGDSEWSELLAWIERRPLASGRIDAATVERIFHVADPAAVPPLVAQGLAAQRGAAG
jgi:hypothetical protein